MWGIMTKEELIEDAKARLLIAEHDLPDESWEHRNYLSENWYNSKDTKLDLSLAWNVRLTPSTFNLERFKKGCPAFTRKGEMRTFSHEWGGTHLVDKETSDYYYPNGKNKNPQHDLYRMDETWKESVQYKCEKCNSESIKKDDIIPNRWSNNLDTELTSRINKFSEEHDISRAEVIAVLEMIKNRIMWNIYYEDKFGGDR